MEAGIPLMSREDSVVSNGSGSGAPSPRARIGPVTPPELRRAAKEPSANMMASTPSGAQANVHEADDPPPGFWARLLGARVPEARTIALMDRLRRGTEGRFPPNKIRNQKYRAWSFIFVVLFNQVCLYVNLYFISMLL